MSGTLASDFSLCEKLARARNWKPETIQGLAVEGSLGYEDHKLCFLYDTGAKLRFRRNGERMFYWAFGKPWIWRGSYLAIPHRTNVLLCEGETDVIGLLDAGAEDDSTRICVAIPSASTFSESWASLFDGKDATLCFDNDQAGSTAVARVGRILRKHARGVHALDWEGIRRAI
jgi:hypothetical protein